LLKLGTLSKLNAFLIPQWGGVLVGVTPDSTSYNFDSKSLGPPMQIFLTQLRTLLGVRPIITPRLSQRKNVIVEIQKSFDTGITTIELDRLLRERTMQNIIDASSTLASLARLIKNLPNMIVQDHIQTQVLQSLGYLKKTKEYLAENDLKSAAINGRQAIVSAEAAFSDKSLVSLLYFPSEHVLAM
jgi:phosphatidylinositol glycan class S